MWTLLLSVSRLSSSLFAEAQGVTFLSERDYRRLSSDHRHKYITSVRKAFVELEQMSLIGREVASEATIIFLNLVVPKAFASNQCFIGGVEQPIVGGKCSTVNNKKDCPGENDFKCGAIFSGVCISRFPVRSISQRCLVQSANNTIPGDQYDIFKEELGGLILKHCSNDAKSLLEGCRFFTKKVSDLNEKNQALAALDLLNASLPLHFFHSIGTLNTDASIYSQLQHQKKGISAPLD